LRREALREHFWRHDEHLSTIGDGVRAKNSVRFH
jgi:hypothetical protein